MTITPASQAAPVPSYGTHICDQPLPAHSRRHMEAHALFGHAPKPVDHAVAPFKTLLAVGGTA
ncbi:hypothetical protein [Streptomyces sp. NBC_01789]|uniref:hypothetical protein n=1 Tax=Streptomyces sp. NBC_01789 TaxID=2975941 RepID=UPI0022537E7E|nr:hypothetical protein [Streptomyces sp. NBC_01789]MCX4451552.1 hypothetical protein [Streptomyces sp. NBC_01789]